MEHYAVKSCGRRGKAGPKMKRKKKSIKNYGNIFRFLIIILIEFLRVNALYLILNRHAILFNFCQLL